MDNKSFTMKIGVIFGITVLIALSIEFILFVINSFFVCPLCYDARYYKYLGMANAYDYDFKINSRGFKDVEFKENKSPGTIRIAATGDSNLWGVVPHKNNFITLLETKLNNDRNKVEIYNMGLPSIGPHDYLSILVHEALRIEPDIFILCFYIGDDFGTRKRHTYSYTASLIRYILDCIQGPRRLLPHGNKTEYHENISTFTDEVYINYAVKKSGLYGIRRPIRIQDDFKKTLWYIKEINNICKRKNITLIIAILPDELQINKSLQKEFFKRLPRHSHSNIDFLNPNRLLDKELDTIGIIHFDITSDFIALENKSNKQYFLKNNYHWNLAGNIAASDLMFKHLMPLLKRTKEFKTYNHQ